MELSAKYNMKGHSNNNIYELYYFNGDESQMQRYMCGVYSLPADWRPGTPNSGRKRIVFSPKQRKKLTPKMEQPTTPEVTVT